MLDTALLLMASHVTAYLTAGTEPAPAGNEAFSGSAASGCFSTREGLLMLAANTEGQWQSLCRVLNNDALSTDPRWKTASDRSEHAVDLRVILTEQLATKTASEWDAQLNDAGVPAGSVMRLAEILDIIGQATLLKCLTTHNVRHEKSPKPCLYLRRHQ